MPIVADDPVTIPAADAVTLDLWGVIGFAVCVDPYTGRTEATATLHRCNEQVWSPRPDDVDVLREPDLLAVAMADPAVAAAVMAVTAGVQTVAAAMRARKYGTAG